MCAHGTSTRHLRSRFFRYRQRDQSNAADRKWNCTPVYQKLLYSSASIAKGTSDILLINYAQRLPASIHPIPPVHPTYIYTYFSFLKYNPLSTSLFYFIFAQGYQRIRFPSSQPSLVPVTLSVSQTSKSAHQQGNQQHEKFPLNEEGITWANTGGKPQTIKRPLNAFFVFRGAREASRANGESSISSNFQGRQSLSKEDSIAWKNLSQVERAPFYAQAKARKEELQRKHPHYRYQPKCSKKRRNNAGKAILSPLKRPSKYSG